MFEYYFETLRKGRYTLSKVDIVEFKYLNNSNNFGYRD